MKQLAPAAAGRPAAAPPPHPSCKRHRPGNLPLHDVAQLQICCAIVAPACSLTAWKQTLALPGHDDGCEPERLRLRLSSIPARAAHSSRRRLLHLAPTAPFTALVLAVLQALTQLTSTPPIASG